MMRNATVMPPCPPTVTSHATAGDGDGDTPRCFILLGPAALFVLEHMPWAIGDEYLPVRAKIHPPIALANCAAPLVCQH